MAGQSLQTAQTTDQQTPAQEPQSPLAGLGNPLSWMQGALGNQALLQGIGGAVGGAAGMMTGIPGMGLLGAQAGMGLANALGGQTNPHPDVPALGSNTDVTATTVRTALTNNPRAIAALDRLTADPSFSSLTAAQQGALLQQFQGSPSEMTGQYLRGIAGYHSNTDKEAGYQTYQNALNPDSGDFSVGGQNYTIRNGELVGANGQVAGNIRTDGTYQLTGQEGRTSIFDDIHSRIRMQEGTGQQARTLLNLHDADRGNRLSNPNMNGQFVSRATDTLKDMRRENVDMRVTDGLRTVEEQNDLYAQGRTRPGRVVTNARGGSSWHNYGVAADITFMNEQGTPHWETGGEYAQLWQRYGRKAEGHGLEWGGDWNFQDLPHVEYHPGVDAGAARTMLPHYNRGGFQGVWNHLGINN